jgi:hypothetical protein
MNPSHKPGRRRSIFPLRSHRGYNPGMSFLLPALAVASAAFCIWLTVRIVNRRERWAKRTGLGLCALVVLYPLSSGPAHWLNTRFLPVGPAPMGLASDEADDAPDDWSLCDYVYAPVELAVDRSPDWLQSLYYNRYIAWWVTR